jgi:GAF domain-containing protein
MNEEIFLSLAQLRGMIGLRLSLRGDYYTVIEVIEDIPAIVVQADDATATIQADAHGYAHRQVRATLTIPVLSADKTEIHAEFLAIDLL